MQNSSWLRKYKSRSATIWFKFAKDHDLKYVQDEMNNVVIYKPGTAGYENAPVVIIQGHMDMVCENVRM